MRPTRCLALLVALLLAPAAAHAAPGDPRIQVLTPPDGATFAPTEDGIAVTYTCPVYHSFDPVIATGGPSDHGLSRAEVAELTPAYVEMFKEMNHEIDEILRGA